MEPHWTAYISALATPVLAVLGVLIAYRQWATARDKLRLDLYERRLAVYQAARNLLGTVYTLGDISQDAEFAYLNGTSGSQWLFGPEVKDYLKKELWGQIIRHQGIRGELESLDRGEERKRLAQSRAELRKWFLAQDIRLDELFMPYLGFQHRNTGWGRRK